MGNSAHMQSDQRNGNLHINVGGIFTPAQDPCRLIQTGDLVRVNGEAGMVEILTPDQVQGQPDDSRRYTV